MEKQITSLFAYQKEALLAALRRDIQSERGKAVTEPQWADYHLLNARAVQSILKVLDPRTPTALPPDKEKVGMAAPA
jgi:hypothetical protein